MTNQKQQQDAKQHHTDDGKCKGTFCLKQRLSRHNCGHRPACTLNRHICDHVFDTVTTDKVHSCLAFNHIIADMIINTVIFRFKRKREIGVVQYTFMQGMSDVRTATANNKGICMRKEKVVLQFSLYIFVLTMQHLLVKVYVICFHELCQPIQRHVSRDDSIHPPLFVV